MNGALDRHAQRPRYALELVAALLVALLVWVLSPVLAPLAVGGFVVLLTSGLHERLVVVLRGRRSLAAAIATVTLTVAVFAPLAFVLYLAGKQAIDGGQAVLRAVQRAGGVDAFVAQLPPFVRQRIPTIGDTAVSVIAAGASRLVAWTPRVFASAGWLGTQALLAIVTAYYLFLQGPELVSFLRRSSPLKPRQTDALLAEFHQVAVGLFQGNMAVALVHGTLAAIGYAIFGVGNVLLFGVLTMIASFVPMVGTALVWAPLAAGLALAHHTGRALGLLAWGLIVVGLSDQVLRPLLSRGHMALPRLLLFLTLFGGLEIMGPKGLLLGPLVGSVAVTAVRMLARQREGLR